MEVLELLELRVVAGSGLLKERQCSLVRLLDSGMRLLQKPDWAAR